jgi:hypothetical protein
MEMVEYLKHHFHMPLIELFFFFFFFFSVVMVGKTRKKIIK